MSGSGSHCADAPVEAGVQRSALPAGAHALHLPAAPLNTSKHAKLQNLTHHEIKKHHFYMQLEGRTVITSVEPGSVTARAGRGSGVVLV